MVQLMGSGNHHSDPETALIRERRLVKLEIEDPLEEENGPINKRSKSSLAPKESISRDASFGDASAYSILDEPSPLGLRLKKSPSLLDLIQMKLSQGSVAVTNTESDNLSCLGKKDTRAAAGTSSVDKLKASNFPASLLKIGTWEYKSKYEGDLVAKCYFAKHKLVWEILEGGLKSKIEIQWSDITALKANCPEDMCSLPDSLFSSGKLILSLESIHCGRQHQILRMDRRANIGSIFCNVHKGC
ncbi:hypothetical protein S83_037121 [Arachis hypogaea]